MSTKRGGNVLGGVILIALGGWFLLGNLGIPLPSLGALWPFAPLLGGGALIFTYLVGRERDSGVLIPGCGGFLIGLFFLAITVGPLGWDDLDRWWPIFPMIGGVTFIAMFVLTRGPREAGLLVPGLGGFLTGLFFFLFTLGEVDWDDMGRLWPGFPLIGGLTFLGTWLFKRREVGLLVPAGLGIAVGVVGFAFTLGGLGLQWLINGWPVALIVVGLLFIFQSFFAKASG